jgi:ATP-dependent RNA helicase RhlE
VSPRNATAPSVEQWIYTVDKKDKAGLLTRLIHDGKWSQALVFSKTKHGANKLTKHLESEGIVAAAIHGNKSQGARTRALADFKAGDVRILVATDIAARGLDIEQLPQVVNFDLPNVPEDYVHRIGRTGRAGSTGTAISLVSADEVELLSDIERLTQKLLLRKEMEGFEPSQTVKETTLNRPVRANKPRKALNSETNAQDNTRHNNNSSNAKKRSAFGHGPKAGSKQKSGGRTATAKPGGNSVRRSDGASAAAGSRDEGRPARRSDSNGNSPYGGSGGNKPTGAGRGAGNTSNSNRGSRPR